jgi:hypothetical protein
MIFGAANDAAALTKVLARRGAAPASSRADARPSMRAHAQTRRRRRHHRAQKQANGAVATGMNRVRRAPLRARFPASKLRPGQACARRLCARHGMRKAASADKFCRPRESGKWRGARARLAAARHEKIVSARRRSAIQSVGIFPQFDACCYAGARTRAPCMRQHAQGRAAK